MKFLDFYPSHPSSKKTPSSSQSDFFIAFVLLFLKNVGSEY